MQYWYFTLYYYKDKKPIYVNIEDVWQWKSCQNYTEP